MVKSLKGGVLFGLLGFVGLASAPSAHADRILTEHEASKLTFSALIAPPSAFHHVTVARRAAFHTRGAVPTRLAASHYHRAVAVRTVAFHGRVVSRHQRNTHHRRG
ncbi:hypothetical protein DTI93_02335 [Parasaccharibacter sp. TMW 2.1884]|uniref:hypothetical protein n=1 Tax=Parasaccharibacter sp. TMW 2.1884 TaxID=2267834 RepID=UPI0013175B71|nr:hypothetical protein [Parasaccharibacter sp. TMW 2.1884]MCL1511243.1 hypothetical protein [Parasaccharibacter sp. TMW 2.1884]QGT75018.1 hypothetical protein GN304_04150 [Bombella sp. ESL0368]